MSASARLHHQLSGRADATETVLFSAGLGGVGGYWTPQAASFGAEYRLLTYDQRGTGRSPAALGPEHDIAAMAADALAAMDDAGVRRCHVVGHAVGGLIGLEMARLAPERISALVVVNGWARIDAHTRRCFAVRTDLLRDSGTAAFVRAQPIFLYPASWLARHEARLAEEERHGVEHFQGAANWLQRVAAAGRFDIRPHLAGIRTRTLVLATRDDVLVPFQASEALAAGLPDARLVVLDGGGHAVNVTDPAAFDAAVLGFLRG